MFGDTIKSEQPPSPKLDPIITPEFRAEIFQAVSSALKAQAECTQSMLKPEHEADEAKCKVLNGIATHLKEQLALSHNQTRQLQIQLQTCQAQYHSHYVSCGTKVKELEQRVATLTEQAASFQVANTTTRSELDTALRIQSKLSFDNDQLVVRNMQALSQLSELQDQYAIKEAEFNDAVFARNQIETRLMQALKENAYWRQHYNVPSTAALGKGSPGTFAVPQVPNRRATAPNVASTSSLSGPDAPRGQKRPRVDSAASSAPTDVATVQSQCFPLRSVNIPQHTGQACVPQTGLSRSAPATPVVPAIPAIPIMPVTSAAPVTPTTPTTPTTPVTPVTPAHPTAPITSPVSLKREQSPLVRSLSMPEPEKSAAPGSDPFPALRKHVVGYLFEVSAQGQRECKLCKSRIAQGEVVPLLTSTSLDDCFAHSEQYHGQAFQALKEQATKNKAQNAHPNPSV